MRITAGWPCSKLALQRIVGAVAGGSFPEASHGLVVSSGFARLAPAISWITEHSAIVVLDGVPRSHAVVTLVAAAAPAASPPCPPTHVDAGALVRHHLANPQASPSAKRG